MGNYTVHNGLSLKFIDHLQDKHFGEIDLYRTDDGRFVMKTKRTHIVGQIRHNLFERVMEWIRRQKHQYVVPIMHIENKTETGLCIQIQATEIYNQYYNFTLLDLLKTKKNLQENELWYILEALLDVVTTLRKNKMGINLDIDNVFLTLKGIPCVYFHQFVSLEDSIVNSQFSMGQQISIILLQLSIGQEIVGIQESQSRDLLFFVGKMCSQYKILGRVVKELLNREKNQVEGLAQILNLTQNNRIQKVKEIKLNKFRYALPQSSAEKIMSNNKSKPQKKMSNPVDFKPKRASENNTALTILIHNKNQREDNNFPLQKQDFKKKINQIIPKKEKSQKLISQLIKRKEETRQQMQTFMLKKQQLNRQKQNKEYVIDRKSQMRKNIKQKKVNEVSKTSLYR